MTAIDAHPTNVRLTKEVARRLRENYRLPVTECSSSDYLEQDDIFTKFPPNYLVAEAYYSDGDMETMGILIDEEH